jgi:uncharacterized Tic20 family protein
MNALIKEICHQDGEGGWGHQVENPINYRLITNYYIFCQIVHDLVSLIVAVMVDSSVGQLSVFVACASFTYVCMYNI